MKSKAMPCNRCGNDIYFDDQVKSVNGKSIPLDVDTDDPHQCSKSSYGTSPRTTEMRLRDLEERMALLESRLWL